MATVSPASSISEDPTRDARTICEAFAITAALEPGAVALRTPDGTVEITWSEYAQRVREIAGGLAALGVRRGDTVGLLMGNRPEFNLCDTAAMHLGATPFSIYNTSPPAQIAHLLANAESRVVVAERQYLERLREFDVQLVCIDGPAEGTLSLDELRPEPDFDFEAAWRSVVPDDVLTLIYTSGTTGPPKGVEVTHANMLAECRAVASVVSLRRGDTVTSYLPSAHIADRWSTHYNSIVYGLQITCVADPRAIAAVLPQLRPTIWGAVPRVLEKIKAALDAAIGGDAATRAAIDTGIAKVRLEQAGEPLPDELIAAHRAAEERVLGPLRAKLGLDRAKWVVVGAAPLSRDVQEFLLGIGLPLTEVYGMSEASCCATLARVEEAKIGSVGPALPGIELQLAPDGELLIRGPTVMRGYRRQPELTAEAVDPEGWLHTGDIATIGDDGHVRIIDRKKELIINAAGKNMSPANIENEIKMASPLIGQVAVIGDRRPYNVALIVLDPDAAAAHARAKGLADASVAAVAAQDDVRALIDEAVASANERLARVEQIKRYELLSEEWLPGGDELTPTMKLKRRPVGEKYAATIEALYAG
jgi:long-subunit acyl-CoA synthetase (AMP-forming)